MARARQLTLLRTPPPRRAFDKRAKRDLSQAQFERALARNGFARTTGGLYFVDARDGVLTLAVLCKRDGGFEIARRATLAKLLRRRGA